MRLIDADKFCDIIDDKCLSLAKKLGYRTYEDASENMKWYLNGVSDAVGTVLDMPTVDAVEVVHGEWNKIEIIDDDSGNGVNDDASQCSVCGDVFDSYYWAKTYFNYCPNCGAKMEVTDGKAD